MNKQKNSALLILAVVFSHAVLCAGLIQPENGSTLNYIHVLFEWEQINDAVSYNFQLDNSNSFNRYRQQDGRGYI